MDFKEKTVSTRVIYEGKIITVHVDDIELPDGRAAIREVVEHSGGVSVAALTDKDELIFVRQYRYPYAKELLELPAGKLERGEDPLEAGIRELEEECGVIAEKVFSLGHFYPTVAYCSETIHLYGATGLHATKQSLDEDEFLSVEKIPLERAVDMVMKGEITDGKTIALVMKMSKLRERGEL